MISKTAARIKAETYMDEGMNATRTVKKLHPGIKPKYATVKGARMLASASFQKSLAEVVAERLPREKQGEILLRNAKQDKNYGASNGAIELAAKLTGDLQPDKRINLNMNVDVKSEEDADRLIEALTAQVKALETGPSTHSKDPK